MSIEVDFSKVSETELKGNAGGRSQRHKLSPHSGEDE